MYPPIKPVMINKAAQFFSKGLTTVYKNTTNLCLELIRFSMISTLIYFDGEYYKYLGEKKEQGLAIGEYYPTLLTNLVASYLFIKAKNNFFQNINQGIYQYERLVIFKGNKSFKEIRDSLE